MPVINKLNLYLTSRRFLKKWQRLNPKTKQKVADKIDIFLKNPFSPNLKTHKLTGNLSKFWSFSVEYNLRIMFKFVNSKKVEFIDIGTHEIYK